MMFPVEEVCGGKGLRDKSLFSSFIIHGALGFPQGHLQGSRSLRIGGVLAETG
jgi:hypothetical protein